MNDPLLLLAELYLNSELNQLGKVRSFHPTQEAREIRANEVITKIKELTGVDLEVTE